MNDDSILAYMSKCQGSQPASTQTSDLQSLSAVLPSPATASTGM